MSNTADIKPFTNLDVNEVVNALLKFSNTDETLKALSDALSDANGLPYSQTFDKLVDFSSMSRYVLIIAAADNGDIRVVKKMSSSVNSDILDDVANRAAFRGHKDIVDFILATGNGDKEYIMVSAARGGHCDIVSSMLKIGAKSYDLSLKSAAGGGHNDIVKFMVKAGATRSGDLEANRCRPRGSIGYNSAMALAAVNGHTETVKLLISLGADNYNRALRDVAIRGGEMGNCNIDYSGVVNELIRSGAMKYDKDVLYEAANFGHSNVVKAMFLAGATDYEGALNAAENAGHDHVVDMIYKFIYGNTD